MAPIKIRRAIRPLWPKHKSLAGKTVPYQTEDVPTGTKLDETHPLWMHPPGVVNLSVHQAAQKRLEKGQRRARDRTFNLTGGGEVIPQTPPATP